MGVVCQILINRNEEGFFRAGQVVTGTLKYDIDEPTRYESIDLSFLGRGKCHWSRKEGKHNRHYRNKEVYVSVTMDLFSSAPDQKVEAGTYEYPFQFLLPDTIPASFKDIICQIQYRVIAKFLQNNFFNKGDTFEAEVPVYGYVGPWAPEPLIFGLKKYFFTCSPQNTVTVKAEIDKTILIPGENICLRVTVNNDSNIPVIIRSEIIKCLTYTASNSKATKIVKEVIPGTVECSPSVKEFRMTEFTRLIPTLRTMYSIQNTVVMIGEYKVKVTGVVPCPHINASVEVPVVIGERRHRLKPRAPDPE
ncbi:arrestin domain-containing protein 17 [Helicoverpa armigera]|uniref:arrestin domain-containing protein 17 n=1 Tax=Helicoverpa armigera TaxID=29058 RepID=UPI003083A859